MTTTAVARVSGGARMVSAWRACACGPPPIGSGARARPVPRERRRKRSTAMALETLAFPVWFLVTSALLWQLHVDNRLAQESLERITEVARFLGTHRQ